LNKKVKVCHLSSVHFAIDTRIFFKQCKTLSNFYQVCLIAIHPIKENIEGIEIIPFKRYHNRKFRVFCSWFIMLIKALKVKAKIYHFHDPELIPCGLILKALGKKVIWDVHENIADDIYDKHWIKYRKTAYYVFSFFEFLACKSFYLILAEKSYLKRYEKKSRQISLVLNYCQIEFFEPHIKTEYKSNGNLFYIGILLENRGIIQILQAIKLLKDDGYNFHFHCVGELFSDLNNQIHALPFYDEIKGQLHFYGRKTLDKGYEIAKNMDIGMCLIWPMKNSMESYPTKLFEYMAVGLPIITSNFPLYESVVLENKVGYCVNPLEIESIKKSILDIHNDVEKSKHMGYLGKNKVKELYSWDSESAELIRVYSRLLGI